MSRRPRKRPLALAMAGLAASVVAGVAAYAAMKAIPRAPDPVEQAIAAGWAADAADAAVWTRQDRTQRECTAHGNRPPDRDAVDIMEREWRSIVYPGDGEVFGDWRRGAELARMPATTADDQRDRTGRGTTGGQCAGCHRLEPRDAGDALTRQRAGSSAAIGSERSGPDLIGPDLIGYGRARHFAWSEHKLIYEQIFNSNAVTACSVMPRFGTHKVLSPDQIRDIVAYLMSPQSPVNAALAAQR